MNNKTVKYATNGALIGGGVTFLLNLFEQLDTKNQNPEYEFNWGELLNKTANGVAVGGAIGGGIGLITDAINSLEKPLDINEGITSAINSVRLSKKEEDYQILSEKSRKLESFLNSNFKNYLAGPVLRVGSTETGTALNYDFDIDLNIPFKFCNHSMKTIYETVYDFLDNEYDDEALVKIRQQSKSIGLIYEFNGERYKIDVVPSRDQKNSNDSTLFVKNKGLFQEDSYTKTNFKTLNSIELSELEQQVLIALKFWKNEFEVPLGSHLLKILVNESFHSINEEDKKEISKSILHVINYISINIRHKRIVSKENTNNVLTDMAESRKRKVKKSCDNILNDFDYQPNSLLKYFGI